MFFSWDCISIFFLLDEMDPKEEKRLLRLHEEISTDESEDSDSDPFSSDDDIVDPNFNEDNVSDSDTSDSNESFTDQNERENIDDEDEWCETTNDIPDFSFDNTASGLKLVFENTPSSSECFEKLWDGEIMDMILSSMNAYADNLKTSNRPHKKNSRYRSLRPITAAELKHFLALCVLQGQSKYPSIRKMFSMDPLYYRPIMHHTLSGRRFEELLRCFSCSHGQIQNPIDKLKKVRPLLDKLLSNYRSAIVPSESLSLDESLMLFRGRLSFRQYMKGKKAKYGVKFYSVCTTDGYLLNLRIYSGKSSETNGISKLETLVLYLLDPYLDRGHHVFMDNFYNSLSLSNRLLNRKTHTTGTLRQNRSGNPEKVVKAKLKRGQHCWMRRGKIYVSKWKDKRDVLCITTKYHPKLITVTNRHGKEQIKPEEIFHYNKFMSGIDRNDQMVNYYSSPRKSIRWYKKVLFHLLDITLWNAYYIKKKFDNKLTFLQFREDLIKEYLEIDKDQRDGRLLVKVGPIHGGKRKRPDPPNVHPEMHFPAKIPNTRDPTKSYHLRCKNCATKSVRKETQYLCKTCPHNPALCVVPCFEEYHKQV